MKLLALGWLGFQFLVNLSALPPVWEHYLCYVVRACEFEFEVLK
jgi:hypothetical protein